MKCRSFFRTSAVIITASLLTLAACRRADKTTTMSTATPGNAEDNGGYASDAAKLEVTNNDVISIADAAGNTGASNLRTSATTATTIGSCATVTNDSVAHVLTIDFGTTDCTCADYKNRRGQIIVHYSGHYKDSGSTHTITFNNYYVNDNQVKGTKSVAGMGVNSSGQMYYAVTVSDTMVLANDSIITQTGNRTRTWLAGYATPERSDDKYLISGTTTVKRANGHTFTLDITTPLQVANDCPYIEAGVVSISSSSLPAGTRTLDYGSGGCDNEADLTIGGVTYHVTLH